MKVILHRFYKLQRHSKQRGDTILEVVIATFILSSIIIATFNILQRALDTNVNVKNRVIALNIAREGLEAVRNIRDTNWLKYSGDRRNKWLCLDVPGASPATCAGVLDPTDIINENQPGSPANYTVEFSDTDNRYYLSRNALPASANFDFQTTVPAQTTAQNQMRLYIDAGPPAKYTHESAGNEPTPFYRYVNLDIENPYDTLTADAETFCGTGDTDDSCAKSRLKIVSRVFWEEEGRTRSVTLEGNLFDFFERDEY